MFSSCFTFLYWGQENQIAHNFTTTIAIQFYKIWFLFKMLIVSICTKYFKPKKLASQLHTQNC